MIDELYQYSYANEPNKSPWRERLWALLPLRETATFPPQADHALVVFFFVRGGTWGAALKPPDIWCPEQGPEDFQDLHGPEASSHHRHGFIHGGPGGLR